jgi:hypothetical protein
MNDNKQEDDMVGVIAGKCVLTDSQGVTHEGVVEDAWCEPCGNGWRSEASVTVYHERVKPEPKPSGRPMTRNDNGTVTFEGIPGSWKLVEGRRPILLTNAWYQAVYEHELVNGSVWSSGLVHGRGQTSGMVAFRRMERCGECGCLSSALDKVCLHCGGHTAASDLTPKPSTGTHTPTPHGRQCAAREALVAARAAESDAVRDAMIDLALRLLGGADEQP